MTDARASAGWVQALVYRSTPEGQTSAAWVQALVVREVLGAEVSAAWVQALVATGTGRRPLRTAGSSRPVQMLWSDLTWRNVLPSG